MKRFALAGNPNCGKTTLFNSLTGSTAHVGNWPGVTVEKRSGTYKKLEEHVSIIDLPGIYSLSPYTNEEVISRNYILDEHPDCVINIIDATNLERNLYLTTQLLEINVPLIVALNMMDVLDKNGDRVDVNALEKKLGVPVVAISALKEDNLEELMKRAYEASKSPREGKTIITNKDVLHLIKDVQIAFKGKGVEDPLFHAIKLVENDELEVSNHKDLLPMVEDFKKTFSDDTFGDDFEAIIADSRYHYISDNYASVMKRAETPEQKDVVVKTSKSDKIDKVLTHRVFGLIILAVILFFVFHLTFSEDLFYIGAIRGAAGLEEWTPCFEGSIYEGLFWTGGGINSPGVILFNFFDMSFSAITDSLSGVMSENLGEELAWLTGFVCDGVLSGLFAILGFLPQILVLFLFFSIMEDTGYMARVAFILDRIFRRFGLSGRAFIPMIMGFGCSVPAMINTRTLADDKERTATIRVIPFFSCGAKLPILVAIAGGMVMHFGFPHPDLIVYGMYVLGVIVALACVLLMRNTTLKGDAAPFIMELPEYHWPQFRSLMIHLWDKAKHFVKKAFTIILASTIVIWFLSNFGWNWMYIGEMEGSILESLGQFIQPIFTPLGFGAQLSVAGWVFAVAAITGLIAKENVIATFSVLAAVFVSGFEGTEEGIEEAVIMIANTGITWQGCVSFIAFNMFTIPCFAAVASAKAELPKGQFKWTLLFWVVASYLASASIYSLLNLFPTNKIDSETGLIISPYYDGQLAWAIPVSISIIAICVLSVFAIKWWNARKAKEAN